MAGCRLCGGIGDADNGRRRKVVDTDFASSLISQSFLGLFFAVWRVLGALLRERF